MSILSFDVGIKNLAFCMINKETNEIISWNVCEIPVNMEKQIAFLDTCEFWNFPFDTVIIEKQPAKNTKMRLIEITLNVYFLMKKIKKVATYSSKHKLGSIGKTTRGKHNYNVRKKYGVAMTNVYLRDGSLFKGFFDMHKKKDDLSDCLLQALSYNKYNVDTLQTTIIQL